MFGHWSFSEAPFSGETEDGGFIRVSGVSATGFVGSVVVGNALVFPTSVSASGFIGDVAVLNSTTVAVTGVSATGQTGTVNVVVGIQVTGVSASTAVGSVSV